MFVRVFSQMEKEGIHDHHIRTISRAQFGRGSLLYLMHDSFARAMITARVADAEQRRLGNHLAHIHHLRRKAARAAVRAQRLSRIAAQAERRASPAARTARTT
jgi:hypothetical protein